MWRIARAGRRGDRLRLSRIFASGRGSEIGRRGPERAAAKCKYRQRWHRANHGSLNFYFYLREVPVTVNGDTGAAINTPARVDRHTGPVAPLTSSAGRFL